MIGLGADCASSLVRTTLTPAVHMETYSPDDNRELYVRLKSDHPTLTNLSYVSGYDLRPFLYPSKFPFQFAKIDALAQSLPDKTVHATAEKAKTD